VKPLSIRLQLSLVTLLLTLVIITVLSISAYIEFRESLLDNVDATLRAMGEGVRAQLDEPSDVDYETELRAIVGYGNPGYAGQCRVWAEGEPQDLFTTGSAKKPLPQRLLHPPLEKQPEINGLDFFNIPGDAMPQSERYFRVLWMRQVCDHRTMNILVARSSDHVYHEVGEFLRLLSILGGGITLAALLLVPKIISWGLRPVFGAGQQLDQITHRNLRQESQTMGEVAAELQPFKSAVDGMLVRLNKAVQQQEQLTADVTHELRTPLAIIKSTLQTLQMKPRAAAEYAEGIDDALRDIGRMEQLVAQLLALARLDAADEAVNPTQVRLDALLESLAEVFDDRAEKRGSRVAFANGSAVSVRGNENELRQLFTNLLDNALQYGPRQGVVRITVQDGPGPWVTACVHDEGGAIPPECLPRLFDRFYRADPSRSQAHGGAGLGLAIVRQIVQRHHGDVTITSNPQDGTSVVVQLPRL
jgi:two-component system OmpR family sensor kinase